MKETTVSLTSETTTPNKVESILDLRRYAAKRMAEICTEQAEPTRLEVAQAIATVSVLTPTAVAKLVKAERAGASEGELFKLFLDLATPASATTTDRAWLVRRLNLGVGNNVEADWPVFHQNMVEGMDGDEVLYAIGLFKAGLTTSQVMSALLAERIDVDAENDGAFFAQALEVVEVHARAHAGDRVKAGS